MKQKNYFGKDGSIGIQIRELKKELTKPIWQIKLDGKDFASYQMSEEDVVDFITWLNYFEFHKMNSDKIFTYHLMPISELLFDE